LPGRERPQLHYDSVRLFLERAAERGVPIEEEDDPLALAGEICRRLEGLPLAIELAAARLRLFSLEELAAALERRLGVLGPARRTAPARHQTLRGALDWSYHLLSDGERRLLRRLAVFVGGWTLEAAAAVASGDEDLVPETAELLALLCEKSLVAPVAP